MHRFTGTVYLRDDPETVLDANVVIDANTIAVEADGTEIGSWPRKDVAVEGVGNEVHLTADGETLVLDVEGEDFLLDLLDAGRGSSQANRRRNRESKRWEAERLSSRFSLVNLKEQALAEGADPIDRRLAILMGSAAVAILVGAALNWGPFRIFDPSSFPIARVLAAVGGLAGLLAVYLAYYDRSRFTGSAVAAAAGFVTFAVAYIYVRSAHLGFGFVLALVGSQLLTVVGVIGVLGSRSPNSNEQPE